MFCPECETEYREGFVRCSDCDVALIEDLAALSAAEASTALTPLTQSGSSALIAELLDRLEKASVPYVVEAGTALELLHGDRDALNSKLEWSARVWVATWMIDRANEVLEKVRAEHREPEQQSPA
jgi:hypothetical protein